MTARKKASPIIPKISPDTILAVAAYNEWTVWIMNPDFEIALSSLVEHGNDPEVLDAMREARRGARL